MSTDNLVVDEDSNNNDNDNSNKLPPQLPRLHEETLSSTTNTAINRTIIADKELLGAIRSNSFTLHNNHNDRHNQQQQQQQHQPRPRHKRNVSWGLDVTDNTDRNNKIFQSSTLSSVDGKNIVTDDPHHQRGNKSIKSLDTNIPSGIEVTPRPPLPIHPSTIPLPTTTALTNKVNEDLLLIDNDIYKNEDDDDIRTSLNNRIGTKNVDKYLSEGEIDLNKGLDERDPLRSNAGTGNSILFDGIHLDQIQHDFRPNNDTKDVESSNNMSTPTASNVPLQKQPSKNSRTDETTIIAALQDQTNSKTTTGTITSPPRLSRAYSKGGRSLTTTATNGSNGTSGEQKITKKGHRRQLTVEETLFGLTTALSAIKNDNNNMMMYQDNPSTCIPTSTTTTTTANEDINRSSRILSTQERGVDNDDDYVADISYQKKSTDRFTIAVNSIIENLIKKERRNVKLSKPMKISNTVKNSVMNSKKADGGKEEYGEDNGDEYDIEQLQQHDEILEPPNHYDEASKKDDENDHNGYRQEDIENALAANTITDEDEQQEDRPDKDKAVDKKKKKKLNMFLHLPYADNIRNEWDVFNQFLHPRKSTIWVYCRYIVLYLWLPALAVAAFFYHKADYPVRGTCEDTEVESMVVKQESTNTTNTNAIFDSKTTDVQKAFISWWIIFICIREVLLLGLSKLMEMFIVDYLALSTTAILYTFGPLFTLLVVQSKGWPFLFTFWGLFNFAFITGNTKFSNHWLYFQDYYGLFNNCNSSGTITSSLYMYQIITIVTFVGVVVSIKRVFISILLGRKTYANYSEQLTKVMSKMLHITQVAKLALQIERKYLDDGSIDEKIIPDMSMRGLFSPERMSSLIETAGLDDNVADSVGGDDISFVDATTIMSFEIDDDEKEMDNVINPDDRDPFTQSLSRSQKNRITQLLGNWEEPGRNRGLSKSDEQSISAVLQFRRALAHMDTEFPFSGFFGLADTRESCIISAQDVYNRLLLKKSSNSNTHIEKTSSMLDFDVIATLALRQSKDNSYELDQDVATDLIRIFRPSRGGSISMIDFVRSIDDVYRELRMLRATVASSEKIDKAIEQIFNVVFYIAMLCIILAATGFDPLALFLSLSSVILAFAFMIGSASAKYFEGVLFILIQRPYGIGDRINVSNPELESSNGGAQGWIVENVTLFTTTLYLAGTNEKATVANGALAKSRIINGARSSKAICTIQMKFGIDTPYKRVEIFKQAVERFVKARPREWLTIVAFRANSIHVDLGYIVYDIVLQHRESWQNVGQILNSKQTTNQFCVELAKKLEIGYHSPPLPVDLRVSNVSSREGAKMTPEKLTQLDIKHDFERLLGDAGKQEQQHQSHPSDRGGSIPLSPQSYGNASQELHSLVAMFHGK